MLMPRLTLKLMSTLRLPLSHMLMPKSLLMLMSRFPLSLTSMLPQLLLHSLLMLQLLMLLPPMPQLLMLQLHMLLPQLLMPLPQLLMLLKPSSDKCTPKLNHSWCSSNGIFNGSHAKWHDDYGHSASKWVTFPRGNGIHSPRNECMLPAMLNFPLVFPELVSGGNSVHK